MANFKKIEQLVKGFSNHRRIQILYLLSEKPGLSLREIALTTKADFRTISQHISKMVLAGLVSKKYDGPEVLHKLTEKGKSILAFCRKQE